MGNESKPVTLPVAAAAVVAEPLTPERRRALTRRHLLDAAATVFARDGFHGATLDAVAAAAGFTKGAVYSNWRSKDDLFVALLDDRIERQHAVVREVIGDEPVNDDGNLARIAAVLRSGIMSWDETWSALYFEFVVYARRNAEAREKLAAALRRSQGFATELITRARVALPGAPKYAPDELAFISLALFEGLGMARFVDPDAPSERLLAAALAILGDAHDARIGTE